MTLTTDPGTTPRTQTPVAAQATQAAAAESAEAATLPSMGALEKLQLVELPELKSLKDGRSLTERLKPEQLKLAEAFAAKQDLNDQLGIAKIGSLQQDQSKQVIKLSGQLIREDARIVELGEVGELANELKARMVDLGVGNLQPRWYDKMVHALPVVGQKLDRLEGFLSRYDKITTRLEEILKAMTDEKAELEDLHAKAGQVIERNKLALENLTVAAAAVELMLKQREQEFRKEIERYKAQPSLDDEDLEQLTLMRNTLSALDRKLVTLKIQRVETRTSIRMMRDLMDAALEARSMLDDQLTLQESIWRNQINNGILEHKIKGVNAMIRNSRDFTNRLIQQGTQRASDTIRELKQMAGEPGVDLAILKGAVEMQKKLHEDMLKASVENRKKLNAAAAQLDAIDKGIGEGGEDLPTLEKLLAEDGADPLTVH
jgi:uncharacterized protein YaaN involved in tellurite resistance